MPDRHQVSAPRRPRMRWLVGAAGVSVAAATLLAFAPAGAAATVNAQLSVTGVATSTSVLGGSEIGVHPGDTVDFKASAVPTAGLDNIPALGPVLSSLLDTLLGQYQVVVSFGSSFPGGAQTVTLGGPTKGACAGLPQKAFTFPDRGTYSFTWKVQYVLPLLLGCSKNGVSDANLNLLAKAGVALNATNSWVGRVVVADNPPKGGISIQLPGASIAPNIGGHQFPTLGVPGITLPTLNVPVPNLDNVKPGAGSSSGHGAKPGGASTAVTDIPNVIPVPAEVVPQGDNDAVFGGGGFNAGALPQAGSELGGSAAGLPVSTPSGSAAAGVSSKPTGSAQQKSTGKHKTIELASGTSATGQLSVVLAIIAIIALTLVAATYARLYVLRRS